MILLYLKSVVCGTEEDRKEDKHFVQLDLLVLRYFSSRETAGIKELWAD
jgi:hypothetical protein